MTSSFWASKGKAVENALYDVRVTPAEHLLARLTAAALWLLSAGMVAALTAWSLETEVLIY
ncbi:MAG: hypothetical protein KKB50_08295 [Planctomycetes bacterium]|nr:hypothetical protein [Planctomycetota bacterium]